MPPPWLTVYVLPSSSVKADRLVVPNNWETMVRPVCESVKRMGSSVVMFVLGPSFSSQVAAAGETEVSKVTCKVSKTAWVMIRPELKLEPMEGSPELSPSPDGD